MKISPTLRILLILLIVFINAGCDQLSKNIVRQHIEFSDRIELLDDRFILLKVENRGAFFGLGEDLPPAVKNFALSLLPTLAMVVILLFIFARPGMSKTMAFGLACMVGGGIGNIFDRIVHGSVTDFLHIDLGGIFKTGIFNLADVSILLGMAVLLVTAWRGR